MTAAARKALEYFHQHGVEARLFGGRVRLYGAEKLPKVALMRAAEIKAELAAVLAEDLPRLEWWNEPVHGWREGRLTMTNMASGQSVTINIGERS